MPRRLLVVSRLLLTAALALVLLTSTAYAHGDAGTRLAVGALTVVVCAAVLVVDTERGRAAFPVRHEVSVAALVVLAVAGIGVCWLLPNGSGVAVPLVASRIAAQARIPDPLRAVVLGLATVALLGYTVVSDGPWWAFLAWPLAVGILFQSGLRVQSRRRQLEDAELLLAQEQALRQEQVRSAAATERTRIARELHDVLAHTLSGLTVTLQATAALLEAEGASTAAREQVGRARALAVDGLAEARTAVASLAAPADADARLDLRTVVERQVHEHRVTTQTETSLEVHAVPADVPAALVGAVSGILREALSNAVRHAPGRPVHVALDGADGNLVLVVEVDEDRPAAPATAGGMGVAGMRQRAVEHGGELDAGPYARGWRVRASLPLAGGGRDA